MKLLVTGAGGFLGRYVVAEAIHRGHEVRALLRPAASIDALPWRDSPQVEVVRCDLRSPHGVVDIVTGVDSVLHLAAAKAGDIFAQLAGTVVATEILLAAMNEARVRRLVNISSFAVYDYLRLMSFARLDESTALERRPERRDEYCRTKLLQEQIIHGWAKTHPLEWTMLRPGVIFGPDNLWTARIGVQLKPTRWIRTGAWAPLPLTYVENCAEAIVMASENRESIGRTLNIVDDETPTQRRYCNMIREHADPRPRVTPIAWTIMRSIARCAWLTNKLLFRDRAKIPGLFAPARLHARCKPLRYTNAAIRNVLGWEPRYGLTEALERCCKRSDRDDQTESSEQVAALPAKAAVNA